MWNGGILDITEGQCITGRKQIALDTGLKESTIEDILTWLERQHQIRQQKTQKYRIITILKWNDYQHSDIKSNNKATTKQQQSDTNKNVKKIKNEKKDTAQSADVPKVIDLFKEVNPSYQRLFGMPPQRAAAERLLKTHGLERLTSMIAFLPKSNATKYAPTITTPAQFEQKLGELIAWSQKQKDIKSANVAFV